MWIRGVFFYEFQDDEKGATNEEENKKNVKAINETR